MHSTGFDCGLTGAGGGGVGWLFKFAVVYSHKNYSYLNKLIKLLLKTQDIKKPD
jgi:hypothetical protein